MYSPAIVEFLGTSLLLAAVVFGGNPLMIVAALAVAIAYGGRISGGHFNPAITAMNIAQGRISHHKGLLYMGAQFGAALFITFISSILH